MKKIILALALLPCMVSVQANDVNNLFGNILQQSLKQASEAQNAALSQAFGSNASGFQNIHTGRTGKEFVNSNLSGMDFSGRDLTGGQFINVNLSNANFAGSDLTGAEFGNVTLSTNVNFAGANLSGVEFVNTSFSSSDFSNAILVNACIGNTMFTDVNMRNVDFSGSAMINTFFTNVDFAGAKRDRILPHGSSCKDINNSQVSATPKRTKRAKVTSAKEIVSQLSQGSGSIDLTVNFKTDSDQLFGSAHAQVAEIAKAIGNQKLNGKSIQIQGHTDSDGSEDHNYDLSYRRATTVQRTLTQDYGINFNQLSIKGFGESRPVASNNDANGRAYNRRVTLVVK